MVRIWTGELIQGLCLRLTSGSRSGTTGSALGLELWSGERGRRGKQQTQGRPIREQVKLGATKREISWRLRIKEREKRGMRNSDGDRKSA